MGFFDRLGREFSKGVGAVGGFVSDVLGGALTSFSEAGIVDPRGGGIARTIGGVVGEAAEVVFGSPEVSLHTGRISIPTTVPGDFRILRGGTSAPASPGTSRDIIPLAPSRVTRAPAVTPIRGIVDTRDPAQVQAEGLEFLTAGLPALPGVGVGGGMIGPALLQLGVDIAEELIPRGIERAREFFRGEEEEEMPDAPLALPGGARLPTVPGLDLPTGRGGLGGGPYHITPSGVRPSRAFVKINPQTGRMDLFGHLGRILLTSRDVSGHRKVVRLANRFARRRRGR